MARPIVARTTLRCWLRLESALHSGDGADLPGVDASVARDGQGRCVLRGTGLAGALRRSLSGRERDDLFGWVDGELGKAGRLWVEDAIIAAPPDDGKDRPPPAAAGDESWPEPETGTRPGVAIDRADGIAVAGLLYARQVIAAGAMLAVRISVDSVLEDDGTTTEKADTDAIARLVGLLQHGIAVGARTSRGYGRARLHGDWMVEQIRYDDPGEFLETVLSPRLVEIDPIQPADHSLSFTVNWHPLRAVFTGSGTSSELADNLPLIVPDPDKPATHLRLLLPGTEIAGALRSRAELICRTIRDTDTPTPAEPAAERFQQQIQQFDLVRAIFGSARQGSARQPAQGARSAVEVSDCFGTTSIRRLDWAELITDPITADGGSGQAKGSTEIAQENERIWRAQQLERRPGDRPGRAGGDRSQYGLRVVERTAIDRWTGAAAKGRLYSRLEPLGESWEDIRVEFHKERLPEDQQDAATVLLLLVLNDLATGWVPLGGATTQGLGAIEVSEITVSGTKDVRWPDQWWRAEPATWWAEDGLPHAWRDAWQQWCDRRMCPHDSFAPRGDDARSRQRPAARA